MAHFLMRSISKINTRKVKHIVNYYPMQSLLPFTPNSKIQISADLSLGPQKLNLEFVIEKGLELIKLPSIVNQAKSIPVKDLLWQKTCFEAFIRPMRHDSYFEFNFSPEPAWACYQFEKYRHPSPPQPCNLFSVLNFQFLPEGRLKIELENKSGFSEFHAGLTAVIELISGEKLYFALKHLGKNPNFHLLESFALERK